MHEIDESEREYNPPCVKRTRRVFPRSNYIVSSACALRCSGAANSCEYVRGRATAGLLIIFRENFVKQTTCKAGFHYKGRRADSARLTLPSENQARFLFRIRYS